MEKLRREIKVEEGNYVKVWVEENGRKEGLWFEVIHLYKNTFLGKLNNNPVLVKTIKDRDEIEIPIKNVTDKYTGW